MIQTLLFNFYRRCLIVLLPVIASVAVNAQPCTIGFSGGVEPMTSVDFAGILNTSPATGGTAYEDFTALAGGSAQQGQSYTITVKGNTFGSYTDYFRVYFDWNQNDDFSDLGESFDIGTITNSTGLDAAQASLSIMIPFSSSLGNVRMRVTKKYNAYVTSSCNTSGWGQAEDYIVNINSGTSCSGTPVAGTATIPTDVCPNIPFNISLTGTTSASGITIQWEYEDGSGWMQIPNATNTSYASTGITIPTSFRAIVGCSGLFDTSNIGLVNVNLPTQCYCTPNYPLSGGGPISLVNFGTLNNPTSATTGGPTYQDFTAMIETVQQGQLVNMIVKGNTMGNYTDSVRVFFDWDQNGSFADPGESFDIGGLTNTTGLDAVQVSAIITIPITATTGNTRMRVTKKYGAYSGPCNTAGYGQAEDYTIDIVSSNSCFGTPVAGTLTAPTDICANVPFNMSLAGTTIATDISLQWEYEDGGGWTPIANATNPAYASTGITIATSYRVVVSCIGSGINDTSNIALVNVNLPTQCYCSISYPLGGGGPISLVSFGSLNNPTSAASGGPSYEDFTTMTETVQQGQSVNLTVKGNTVGNYTDSVRVFFDWDQNGSFADPGESFDLGGLTNSTGLDAVQVMTSITIPFSATIGNTRMRVTKKYAAYSGSCNSAGYGQAEDYAIDVVASNVCTGTPSAGTASAPSTICANTAFSLTLTNYTVDAGTIIQWQLYNTLTALWEDIPSASTALYGITGITDPTDYRAVVTCTTGNLSDTSNEITVNITPFLSCYCVPANGGSYNLTNVSIINTTLNNTSGGTSPYYISYPATGDSTATLMEGSSYSMTINLSFQCNAGFWIDYDQNGIYDASEYTPITTANATGMATFTIPLGTLPGLTGMRVRSRNGVAMAGTQACLTYSLGETEDYQVTIIPAVLCSGTPSTGTINAPANICPNIGFNLTLSGYTDAPDITIQWEEDNGSGWQPAAATGAIYPVPAGITTPASYRAVVTCNGTTSATASVVAISVNAPGQCYCSISFPSGDVEPISLVDFAGIFNASADTVGTPLEYEDFTAISGIANQGELYTINVKGNTNGNYTDQIRVYIDWDQNGLFTDPGEDFTLGSITNSNGLDAIVATANITVPTAIPTGPTRMRVTKKWSSAALPCNNSGYGQAEDYSLIIDFPLAIKLKDISATNVSDRNRIDWSSASEEKGDFYELERSTDGKNFSKIAGQESKGTASTYTYWDQMPFNGINYYRLKLINAGDRISYSKIVTATTSAENAFTIDAFPNPVTDIITVNLIGVSSGNPTLTITDLAGRIIKTVPVINAKMEISLKTLAQGVYLVRYTDDQHSTTIKIEKQ